ncbi:hypothetical protein SN811_08680 [Ligilactobacillus agilis]|uniref:Spore coat protein CotH n=1 Tax=Ligilactobacillus agilis TaxID=1601 RepID=A0A6F9Y4K4_9LACO|nr:CotH kinase family protein [Ligilactobacillus agilis]GET12368.1 hypothetical protein SN811_08680 [Ligilactobacillus agilis]
MAIFENENEVLQDSSYRAHLNRNWDNGNKQFDAMNARINAKSEKSAPDEVVQARIDANGNVYKSLAGRLDANQKATENASYIANSAYTYAKTELYKKLSQMNNGVKAFADINKLKQAYPNGSDGIFVTVDTGHQWYYVDGLWRDAGIYQASSYDSELRDARVELDGTNANTIGNAIRDQFFKEKKERIADLNAESVERSKTDAQIEDRLNFDETALELKETKLVDNFGNFLVDGSNFITGNVVLPKTDSTGLEVGVPADSGSVGYTFLGHLKEYGLPILELDNLDIPKLQKSDGKLKNVNFIYDSKSNSVNANPTRIASKLDYIKVQGASSAVYPKKNFTLKFEEPVLLKKEWGSQDKYVIKADWVDFSQMRNEFGAYLWGLMRKTRIDIKRDSLVDGSENFLIDNEEKLLVGETTKQFATPNFGAIDSFPILVVINGIYWGLYSLTVPKDDWMANMGGGSKEAIVSAENHGGTTRFLEHVKADSQGNLAGSDFSVEYVSNEDKQQWVVESLNRTIDSVVNTTGTVEGIRDYIDVDSATDYFILNALILNSDAFDKNFLLQTWDGKKWFFAAYDMDATFGNRWDGKAYYKADWLGFKEQESLNRVFHLIYTYDKNNFINRWETLRDGLLSNENLSNLIYNYAITIPKAAFDYEAKRWPRRPGTITNNVNQIQSWLMIRLNFLDKEINNLKL